MSIVGPLRQQIPPSTEVVNLSYWVFALWWLIIFAVHTITCLYNALYAYCYWKLDGTYLNTCLEFYAIGLAKAYHTSIALVHAGLSVIHGTCILFMLGGSFWQCSFAFTPWSSSNICCTRDESTPNQPNPRFQCLSRMYNEVTYPCGLFGVRGKYFGVALVCREIVETALQTVQAYRMSVFLPRALLNRFYALLLVINCWSSVIVGTVFSKRNEAQRRFACIVFDCLLDLMACMGVELIVLLSYIEDYDPEIKGFDGLIWYNDEWVARALNEFQIVLVVSWSDLVSRVIFSLGLVITTTSMKKLLGYLPRSGSRVSQSASAIIVGPAQANKLLGAPHRLHVVPVVPISSKPSRLFSGCQQATHVLFFVWGTVVLGLHIHASLQPPLPQCLMQVRPWTVMEPSCYLVGLDCNTLGISGTAQEVEEMWSKFDSSTVVQLLIRHCPSLAIPDKFNEFHGLRGIKVYNSTIQHWSESAELSNANHPEMSSLFMVRVNMTDGLLPNGLQSTDFPERVNDIEMCVTNLRELPPDLDAKWPRGAIIMVEYSELSAVPLAVARLSPLYLFLTGNSISELPAEVFGVEGMAYLGISETNIHQLPQNVTQLSSSLQLIKMDNTGIAFFWSWVDKLVGRVDNPTVIVAGVTPYCADLEESNNGVAEHFHAPYSTEYSAILMNSSEASRPAILQAVDCSYLEKEPFYPLAHEDRVQSLRPT